MKSSSKAPTPIKAKLAALFCALCLVWQATSFAGAQANTITVQVDQPGAAIPATLFGLFFEDINFAADGGIYPELVKNKSFEITDRLLGWRPADGAPAPAVLDAQPLGENNTHYLRLKAEAGAGGGVINEGFRGMGVRRGAAYTFSVYARRAEGEATGLQIELSSAQGKSLGQAKISGLTPQWKKYTAVIRPSATEAKAHLRVSVAGQGVVDVDVVSLYPQNTWQNRENGLRADLVGLLKDLKPGFLRFPGGCIVEGKHLETRYQWKTTVGDLASRIPIVNRWNDEFKHRPAPDYYQSFGLGFYEYFQLSEDIGAEPMPIINCGMACQFNSAELAPLEELDHYIQDAFDLIEFANGPATSTWGRKRAEMGHPAPFNLKFLGVGNEQWGPQYLERYDRFAKALKEKYPQVSLIGSAGPSPDDERFKFLSTALRERRADIIDEHYYKEPRWFRENAHRYDKYPRQGPKIFAGEFAAQSKATASPENRNNWECALSEAAFMTGLERNADVVLMASYAPLFAHTEAWQWTPNLIWFDNLNSYGTPNYYVQKMFSAHRGTRLLPVLLNNSPQNNQQNLYASAALDERAGEVILKVVNTEASPREVMIDLAGAKKINKGRVLVLSSADLKAENTLQEPTKVAPVEQAVTANAGKISLTLKPNSLSVLRAGGR